MYTSFLLFLFLTITSILVLSPVISADTISAVAFYSDAACTQSLNPSLTLNTSKSYSLWPSINPADVSNNISDVSCFNNPIPGVASARYECFPNITGSHALLAAQYTAANCSGLPQELYDFFGPLNQTCVLGFIDVMRNTGLGYVNSPAYATFTCTVASPNSSQRLTASGMGSIGTLALMLSVALLALVL